MAQQSEVAASSSWPAQFLHYASRRRQRFYGIIAIAVVMLAAATFIYGGFATGIDFGSYVPRPKDALPPAHNSGVTGADGVSHGGNGANGGHTPVQTQIPVAPGTQAQTETQTQTETKTETETETQTQTGSGLVQSTQTQTQTETQTETQAPAVQVQPGIPTKIWQILLPKSGSKSKQNFVADPKILVETPSWLAKNPDYTYTLVGQKGGDEFVRKHFGSNSRLVEAYEQMPNVGMKSDLLRYLILAAEGGVYTDTDTVALRPIDEWVPRKSTANRAARWWWASSSTDPRTGPGGTDISHWVQFCQWTIAASPRPPPCFGKMVDRIPRVVG
ncbi:hypothetical protein CHGG_04456 [Chaetomium globosum CBS 148.51]|uniref:Uncharacterized protein n=1 Tax=Chaetomium globosum (strain ATCC 6205 / CBS 148.51 / DSM 1962 / NBRC 6347 / NRRL 1970) TaxID=306901 RepID=Q2H190_CHAGB|nr:uncharacterized protein CHGG_04456 [Chaetomium globosum CBS 148.51]EAQ87837.1 hypothetical protein CHGG_04456 [Chaetomium globosum CBS 148.51]